MQLSYDDPYQLPRLISRLRGGLEWLRETGHTHLPLNERGREALAQLTSPERLSRLASLIEARTQAHLSAQRAAHASTNSAHRNAQGGAHGALPSDEPPPPTPLRDLPGVALTTEIWGLDRFSSFEVSPPRLEDPPQGVVEVMRPVNSLKQRWERVYGGGLLPTQEELSASLDRPSEGQLSEGHSHEVVAERVTPKPQRAPAQPFGGWLSKPVNTTVRSPVEPKPALPSPAAPSPQVAPPVSSVITRAPLPAPSAPAELPPLEVRAEGRAEVAASEALQAWSALEQTLSACHACPRSQQRQATQGSVVAGTGSRTPKVMFVESHPSALSAITGLPLSDPEASMAFSKTLRWLGLSRHEVYTTSLLKCASSAPSPAEWAKCRAHFERELQLARPAYIVTLGGLTSQILLNSSGPQIGAWSDLSGVPVLSTHHFSDAVHPQGVELKHQMAAHLNRLRARLEREDRA